VVKGLHTLEECEAIGKLLAGAKAYYLQGFRESERVLGMMSVQEAGMVYGLSAFSSQEMEQMADVVRKYVDKVVLRGVE